LSHDFIFPGNQVEKLTIVDETNELQFEDDEEEQTQAHELPDYACKYCGLHDPVILLTFYSCK
jgi:regulator of nonsense transcripts 1